MAGFVEGAEEGVAEVVFVVAGGDAGVAGGDAGGEGVDGGVETAGGEVEADGGGGEFGELFLLGGGVVAFEDFYWGFLGGRGDGGDEGDEGGAEFGEDAFEVCGGFAGFEVVEEGVVSLGSGEMIW